MGLVHGPDALNGIVLPARRETGQLLAPQLVGDVLSGRRVFIEGGVQVVRVIQGNHANERNLLGGKTIEEPARTSGPVKLEEGRTVSSRVRILCGQGGFQDGAALAAGKPAKSKSHD